MKRGSLVLSLFLISILVISGCAQMAPRKQNIDLITSFGCEDFGCQSDGDCCMDEVCTGGICTFSCGDYNCYVDGDEFEDYCLSLDIALCGECLNDDDCEATTPGSTCEYNVSCGAGPFSCNECVVSDDECTDDAGCEDGEYCENGECLPEMDIGEPFSCGGYTCYEDGDTFNDLCLDSSAVPALCGECMDDDWCTAQYPGSTCEYGVECGYGGGICNECVASGAIARPCTSPPDKYYPYSSYQRGFCNTGGEANAMQCLENGNGDISSAACDGQIELITNGVTTPTICVPEACDHTENNDCHTFDTSATCTAQPFCFWNFVGDGGCYSGHGFVTGENSQCYWGGGNMLFAENTCQQCITDSDCEDLIYYGWISSGNTQCKRHGMGASPPPRCVGGATAFTALDRGEFYVDCSIMKNHDGCVYPKVWGWNGYKCVCHDSDIDSTEEIA